jgi:predicted amidophosphoribosyltransferase
MQCKICGQDNPTEARFCSNCGATLVTEVEPLAPAEPVQPPATLAISIEYVGFWTRFVA